MEGRNITGLTFGKISARHLLFAKVYKKKRKRKGC